MSRPWTGRETRRHRGIGRDSVLGQSFYSTPNITWYPWPMHRKRWAIFVLVLLVLLGIGVTCYRSSDQRVRYRFIELEVPAETKSLDSAIPNAIDEDGRIAGLVRINQESFPAVWNESGNLVHVVDTPGVALCWGDDDRIAGTLSLYNNGFIWSPSAGLQMVESKQSDSINFYRKPNSRDHVALSYEFSEENGIEAVDTPEELEDVLRGNKKGLKVGWTERGWPKSLVEVEMLYQRILRRLGFKVDTSPDARKYAVFWKDGRRIDLNNLVELPEDWGHLTVAHDVNERGWIIGVGAKTIWDGRFKNTVPRGFLLKPIEETTVEAGSH